MARATRAAASPSPAVGSEDGPGTCRISVYRVRLERERYLAFPWREFEGLDDAVALFRAYAGMPDREHMVSIHLDARNRVSGIHTVSVGSLQRSDAGAREVFKAAILGSAASIVLVHNHPSGDPSPSRQDAEVSRALEAAGRLVGIPVLDHVVVGDPGCASLRDLGLLELDPRDPDSLRAMNTDEGWAASLENLKFGAAFVSGGMRAVRQTARGSLKSGGERAFVPVPARSATLNPMITVEPDSSLRPEEVEPLLEALQRRVGAALERALDGVPAAVRIDDVGLSFVREVPVFPVAAGSRVFRDSSEISEEVEALGAGTGIGGVVHDATGRAFRCNLWAGFARLPGEDRLVGEVFTLDGNSG
jgi:DNA repair protein RadC